MASLTIDPRPEQPPTQESPGSVADCKPVVVGVYGVSGSGKSYLLTKLQQNLLMKDDEFEFFEGSAMIASLTPGGLSAFKTLPEEQKLQLRKKAIDTIRKQCTDNRATGVVAGHFMFWDEGENVGTTVITPNDLETYTHILYLKVDADVIKQRRSDDTTRERGSVSVTQLDMWQQQEETKLRDLCYEHRILFSTLSLRQNVESEEEFLDRVAVLLLDFAIHSEYMNQYIADRRLKKAIATISQGRIKTMLVMDADKTLAPQDVGKMFWKKLSSSQPLVEAGDPLKTLFSSPMGYSYDSFRQAMLLYEEAADDEKFDTVCEQVASEVTMYPEFVSLLEQAAEQNHVGAMVVTCGLRRVWEKVLDNEGLSDTVVVMGGGRIDDRFVVTSATKAALVAHLQNRYKMEVWAFGDSPLDLPMLIQADEAIVVVGEEGSRSKSMEVALRDAIDIHGLNAYQVVLPSTAPPRLNTISLPLIRLSQAEFDFILFSAIPYFHATHKSAGKLLTTPTRNADVAGPRLRESHFHIGRYLATEFLGDAIGLESYKIPHVQNRLTDGHMLAHEKKTVIVPLMRGGEPMALGVSEVFPRAMLVHASKPEDIKVHHLETQRTIILVDSVINSGKSIVEFLEHVRKLHATIRIVIVANVVQAKFISIENRTKLERYGDISIVALRASENQYTGTGGTDTGNRLFNTTHLP